ncbi:class C sortase [[Ruminococcus] torques]|uniref:class C sortase n=1 Tax=[Ruminococcus] torques TaxID=33039 RepID=UPI00243103C2|nr:class C sortase [[Ruminococcus] torques]
MFKIKKYLSDIVVAIILIAGVGLLAYPTIADYVNELHSSKAIGSYVEKTKDLSKEEKENLLEEAREYNKSLVDKINRYYLNEEEKKRYNHILNITKTGIMAYIEIPKLNVYMPVYHGTDEGVLQIAAGHLPGSSFPVGGESTHSLISGHSGLPSAKLFTDIDKLQEGDLFFVHVFDEVLAYRVNQIKVVLPDDVETLEIEKGKDYVTLITCTPYGVNSHRLLVRGERTAYKEPESKIEDRIEKNNRKYTMLSAGVILALISTGFLISVFLIKRRRRKLNEK